MGEAILIAVSKEEIERIADKILELDRGKADPNSLAARVPDDALRQWTIWSVEDALEAMRQLGYLVMQKSAELITKC